MPYLFVGAGQAGSAIVDDVFEYDGLSRLAEPLVFNSTIRDLQNLSNVGEERWFGISEGNGIVPGGTPGFEELVTGGFGRQPELADEVMESNRAEVTRILGERFEGPDSDVPFAFVFLGLGGGTGCGIARHLVEAIRDHTGGVARVIAVCVLPNTSGPVRQGEDEVAAGRQAWNATYGLNRLENAVDGIVLVDNQRLAYEDAAEGRFAEYNEYVAAAIVDLVSGVVLEGVDPAEHEDVDAPIIDVQDIVTSLSLGSDGDETGYAVLGRAVTTTRSLPGYFVPFVGRKAVDGEALSHLALSKRSVADVDPADARKAIGQIRAPPAYIADDDYRIQVSVVRKLLDGFCSEVNLGMVLTDRNLASFTTLLTYAREDLDRIAELEARAGEHRGETPP